jgi:diaminohydroxyphosphoribosylaminopyrimidine deaminase/5-amino-6-(5-phosphoribosylamino)uracil reductase
VSQYSGKDHEFMARAIRLAKRGLYITDPNPRVGCVIVRDEKIIGEGWHEQAGEVYAEINALKAAGDNVKGATAYVTLEPCCHHGKTPPCTDALIKAGISRVVAAMQDPHDKVAGQGLKLLKASGIETQVGLMESQAEALNPGFIKRMKTGKPFVRVKLAMSMDGRTAMASGESKWITSEAARSDVQHWRARSSVIMTGVGTVLADDPAMTARINGGELPTTRVVIDTNLSMPQSAKMLSLPGKTIIMTTCDEDDAIESLQNAGAEIIEVPAHHGSVDLSAVLDELGKEGFNEVMLETGATLSGAMLQADLIDEMIIYMAPTLMGDGARPLFRLPGVDNMKQKIDLDIHDVRSFGKDLRIIAKPVIR